MQLSVKLELTLESERLLACRWLLKLETWPRWLRHLKREGWWWKQDPGKVRVQVLGTEGGRSGGIRARDLEEADRGEIGNQK